MLRKFASRSNCTSSGVSIEMDILDDTEEGRYGYTIKHNLISSAHFFLLLNSMPFKVLKGMRTVWGICHPTQHTNRFQFPLKRICERERSVNYRVSLGSANGEASFKRTALGKQTIKDTLMEKRKPQNRSHSLYSRPIVVCRGSCVRWYGSTGQVNLI